MSEKLVIDSSTIIGLERAGIDQKLGRINQELVAPEAVIEELGGKPDYLRKKHLKARSRKKADEILKTTDLDRGEIECIVLAHRDGHEFIVSDDRKLLRQRAKSRKEYIKEIKILGFSYILHLFKEQQLIQDIWNKFQAVVEENGWERSEVYASNHTFLVKKGYRKD